MLNFNKILNQNSLVGQITRFLGISGLGWILDFCSYLILGLIFSNLFIDNVVSSLIGATFVFLMSPKLIFTDHGLLGLRIKYLIYVIYQLILILAVSYLLTVVDLLLNNYVVRWISFIAPITYLISKMAVTPVAMTCNFLTLKLLFEKL